MLEPRTELLPEAEGQRQQFGLRIQLNTSTFLRLNMYIKHGKLGSFGKSKHDILKA
jgi:hypothetical protein